MENVAKNAHTRVHPRTDQKVLPRILVESNSATFSNYIFGMALKQYELDEEQKKATLLYDYNGQIIKYTMYMNNADSSFGQIEPDTVTDQYEVEAGQGIIVQVKEYQIEGQEGYRYIAEFEYMDAQYELKGKMEREEFDKILKNLAFFGNNA